MFFNKDVSCNFTKEAFQDLKDRSWRKRLAHELQSNKILKNTLITVIAISLCCFKAYAVDNDVDINRIGNNFLITARKGLKWVCIVVSIFGLYIGAIKDDKKKSQEVIIACLLIYLGSYLVPWLFDGVDKIFTK